MPLGVVASPCTPVLFVLVVLGDAARLYRQVARCHAERAVVHGISLRPFCARLIYQAA